MKVIKIGAIWCSGCLVMKPRWKNIEAQNSWLQTEYYDFDERPDICEQYHVQGEKLPVFIFLDKNGAELERKHGEISEKDINELITKYKEL